jgi:hypothetical protein
MKYIVVCFICFQGMPKNWIWLHQEQYLLRALPTQMHLGIQMRNLNAIADARVLVQFEIKN